MGAILRVELCLGGILGVQFCWVELCLGAILLGAAIWVVICLGAIFVVSYVVNMQCKYVLYMYVLTKYVIFRERSLFIGEKVCSQADR